MHGAVRCNTWERLVATLLVLWREGERSRHETGEMEEVGKGWVLSRGPSSESSDPNIPAVWPFNYTIYDAIMSPPLIKLIQVRFPSLTIKNLLVDSFAGKDKIYMPRSVHICTGS